MRALGHVDGGGEQQQKTHSFSQSVFAGAEVYVSTCACGRCACVCVWGGAVNRIPRPCYCLGFLKVTVCLEIPLLVLLCEQHHDCRYHHQQ